MMCCVAPLTSSSKRSSSFSSLLSRQGRSDDDSPSSDGLPSPTFSLTSEYTHAIHTNSYNDIWSKIHPGDSSFESLNIEQQEVHKVQHLLSQVLSPSRDAVQEALQHAKPSTLIHLVSSYFDQSEKTSHLFLLLQDSVHQTRFLYRDLHNLFAALPLESDADALSQSLCDRAFDVFLQFDSVDNPFTAPHTQNFHDMRHCFSRLNQQLHHRLGRSRFRVRLLHRPLLPAFIPSKITKKELAHLEQLDAAAKGTYVLFNDLDTIYCLSERLYIAIESDKFLVHLGLQRGRDRHPIHWVAKQLKKNRDNFLTLLMDLEEHVCLCFAAINRGRSVLLEKIRPQ